MILPVANNTRLSVTFRSNPVPTGLVILPPKVILFACIFLSVFILTPLFIVNVPIFSWSSVNVVFVPIVIFAPPLSTQFTAQTVLVIIFVGFVLSPYSFSAIITNFISPF